MNSKTTATAEKLSAGQLQERFDDVLKSNIQRLTAAMPETAALPFNLTTITSLILLIERESEREAAMDAPPNRYTEATLLDELSDIGLEINPVSRQAVQRLEQMGFITTETDGRFAPRNSTRALVNALDNLFPGMPGMNLVAYVLQTIDEAASGRKDVEYALRQFDQTLLAQGVALVRSKPEPRGVQTQQPDTEKSENRRQSHLKRLSQLRAHSGTSSTDAIRVTDVNRFQTSEVKSLFPRKATTISDVNNPATVDPPDTVSEKSNIPVEKDNLNPEMAEPDFAEAPAQLMESGGSLSVADGFKEDGDADGSESKKANDAGCLVQDYEASESVAVIPDAPPDLKIEPSEPVSAVSPSQVGIPEPFMVEPNPPENRPEDQPADTTVDEEEIVAERVQAFQEDLAMTCPTCHKGKVRSSATEKGKVYYVCENNGCNFISWGKPYHYTCPHCRNSFLVEFAGRSGASGLKCPKATCSYQQNHLSNPAHTEHAASGNNIGLSEKTVQPKKRKRVVKKRRVRKKH